MGFLEWDLRAGFYEPLALNTEIIPWYAHYLVPGTGPSSNGARAMVSSMAKQVRLTLQKAIAKANLRRAEAGQKPITMNSLAVQSGVASTTIARLARTDDKAASALSLDLASKIVTVLDCGIEDLLEVI